MEPSGNQMIDALSPSSRRALLASARRVSLSASEMMFGQNRPVATVHFPLTAVLSLVTYLRDGAAIEVCTIGNEGTSGFPVVLGTGHVRNAACICQVSGEAISVPATMFEQELERNPQLRDLGLRYVDVLLTEIVQGVACSRMHHTVSRCARWLLTTHDRAGTDSLRLTHEFLSTMLGTRRASVSEALGTLTRAELVRTHHGTVEIIDRLGLEEVACECYAVIRDAACEMTASVDLRSGWAIGR